VPRSLEEPDLYQRVNVMGTFEVLEAARAAGVARVVSASSSSVYGDRAELPKTESLPVAPCSPYAASKCAGEHLMRAWACGYGLATVSLRYFNVFGGRQRADSAYAAAVPTFANALRRGTTALIHGDGAQTRDFTHVDNAVHANLLAGSVEGPLRGEAVNVASGGGVSVIELLRAMARLAGVEPRVVHGPPRPGDVPHSRADLTLAGHLLGYRPIVGFEEGLRRTVEELTPAGAASVAARRSG
jgi:UDP-glucose 4-epimerase